ncbi:MAG: helix-turn-helix domain-containing protein [Micavibrio sp.]
MTITTAQIRGARGILNWSQSDLAERTGISSTSIGSIENGQSTPRASTLQTIRKTFETAGIEFIGLDGVRLRSGDIRTYKGQEGLIDFYEDIYQTVKDYKGDILVSNVDERLFVKYLGDFAETHIERMKALPNIRYKILVREGDDYVPGSDYAEYRGIPTELFASVPFYVYADKLATIVFESELTVIVMDYPAIANAYRTQFADMWQRAHATQTAAQTRKAKA